MSSNKCTESRTEPYMMVFYGVGEAIPLVTSSIYILYIGYFLMLMLKCCHWHVTGGLSDFVSLPELLLDSMPVRDISVRASVWACSRPCLCVTVNRKRALHRWRYLNVMKLILCVGVKAKRTRSRGTLKTMAGEKLMAFLSERKNLCRSK